MNKLFGFGGALILASAIGCGGDDGATGPAGATGQDGVEGPEGPQGDPGGDGGGTAVDPSLSAVLPGTVYLEHDIEVTISGHGTEWTSAATVDFGAGITASSTILASPTSIVATIEIAPDAALGARDVTVTDGDNSVTYTGAFMVEAPLETSHLGTEAQGSILLGLADQMDINAPFDELGGSVTVTADGSSEGLVLDGSTYGLDYLLFVDVTATAAATDVVVESGLNTVVSSRAPGAVDVQARTATTITPGTPATATYTNAFDSYLYSFDATASQVVEVSITSGTADPTFFLLPASGAFADLIDAGATAAFTSTAQVETYYLVVFDLSGDSGYDFTIDVAESATDEVEPNDACTTAQAIADPTYLENLTLSSGLDEDWFEVTATSADIGDAIHAVTWAGDIYTDTYIEVFESDCTTPLGPPSSDATYHENHLSAAIPAAGTYYIRVSASPTDGTSGAHYNFGFDMGPAALSETEANDTQQTANAVTVPSLVSAQIEATGYEDWFAVALIAGQTLTAETLDGGSDTCASFVIDNYLDIYDTDGTTVLAYNDDSGLAWCALASSGAVGATGTYYVKVTNASACTNCTYTYTLDLTVN
jgi:hypothetical protein